jgi:hypothetical protein
MTSSDQAIVGSQARLPVVGCAAGARPLIFEVDPLACPACHGIMCIVDHRPDPYPPPDAPHDHAETFGVRGGATAVASRSPLASAGRRGTRPDRRPSTSEAHRRGDIRAEDHSPVLATQRAGADIFPTPIECPIAGAI